MNIRNNAYRHGVSPGEKLSEKQAQLHYNLGRALAKKGDLDGAIASLQRALEISPDWLLAMRALQDLQGQRQKILEKATLQQATDHCNAGKDLLEKGEYVGAIACFRRAIEVHPGGVDAYLALANTLVQVEEPLEAIAVYRRVLELKADLWEVHHKLGNLYRDLGRKEEAIAAYERSIELRSDFAWNYDKLADVLVELQEWQRAIVCYEKLVELQPDFAWGYYKLGDVCGKLERWDGAVQAYRLAIKLDEKLPQVYEKLGDVFECQTKFSAKEISEVYRKAIENDPNDLQLYYKALEVNPQDAEISFRLANVLRSQGKLEQAITFYKNTLQFASDKPQIQVDIWQNLGNVFQRLGRLSDASNAYHQAVKLEPNQVYYHFCLIRVLQQLGKFEDAVKIANQAIQIQPRLTSFYANWGVIKENIGATESVYKIGDRHKVAVCGWELAHNSVGRVYTLAQLYQGIADVEIIGSIFPQYGRELWEPIRNTAIPCHSFVVEDESLFLEQAMQLVLSHPYDVVHLSKPRMPNILFGLLYKLVWNARVIVDIDDEELGFVNAEEAIDLDEFLKCQGNLPELNNLTGQQWTQIAVGLAKEFDAVTVSNPALQSRYGGQIIRHARDERVFQPSPERRMRSREKFGITQDKKVVLFFGTPRNHKGLLETAQALSHINRDDLLFVIVGDFPDQTLKSQLENIQGVNYIFLGNQPFDKIPNVVAVGDICILLNNADDSLVSKFQVPAKLSDALGMGLAILLSESDAVKDFVSDESIVLVNKSNLEENLRRVLSDSKVVKVLGNKAQNLFKMEFSYSINRERIKNVIDSYITHLNTSVFLSDQLNNLLNIYSPIKKFLPNWGGLKLFDVQQKLNPGISIIVLTLNGATLLDRLLYTFFATNTYSPIEIIIIDHGSVDETAEIVSKHSTKGDIQYINRYQNFSFSDSSNYGVSLSKYSYLLFLNNDIIFTEDVLPLALTKLDDSIGAVGIRLDDYLVLEEKESAIQHTGISFVWNEKRGYFQPEQIRHKSLNDYLNSAQVRGDFFPPAVTGAFLLCRKDEFQCLGGFSRDYNYGLEDVDLCLRLRRDLQKKCYCINHLSLQHLEGATRKRKHGIISEQIIEKNHQLFKQNWDNYIRGLIGKPKIKVNRDSVNVLFVLYDSVESNSGYQAQLHATRLLEQGIDCLFAVPDNSYKANIVRPPLFPMLNHVSVLPFSALIEPHTCFPFANRQSPDLIYACTPREVVRKFVEKLLEHHASVLVIHLEDNEEYLTEVKVGISFAELTKLPEARLDRLIPTNRYHPIKGKAFLERADGLTMIIDTLKQFNTQNIPDLVLFAPVDERLFYPRPINFELRRSLGISEEYLVLAYTGNIHTANRDEVWELYRALKILNQQGYPTVLLRTGLNDPELGVESWGGAYEKYLGWVERDQIPEILAAADILVQTGCPGLFNDQRIPSKLPEYFAIGRPVVLPRANLGLQVEHGLEGYVLERANAENICNAVREIYGNKELADKLSVNSIVFLRRYIDSHKNNLLEFICSFVSGKYNIEMLSSDELTNIHKILKNLSLNIDSFEKISDTAKNISNNSNYHNLIQRVISNFEKINNSNNLLEKVLLKKENFSILEQVEREIIKRNLTTKNSEKLIEDLNTSNNVQSQQNTLENAIINAYKIVLNREPVQSEIEEWLNNVLNGLKFEEFFHIICNCEERKISNSSVQQDENLSDGEFIKYVYMTLLNRGCHAGEIYVWEKELATGKKDRYSLLNVMFKEAIKMIENENTIRHDGLSCQILGTSKQITIKDWANRKNILKKNDSNVDKKYDHNFNIISEKKYLVSAIASLYCGKEYIEKFMDNITTQSCFRDYCELIIIDANSPENESEVIRRYMNSYKNINYIRMNYRIGIYDAWNCGVKAAKGEYLTNTNLDDLRRKDSLEIQAGVLDNLNFVDVVYQDFYYTFDFNLSYEEIALYDYQSNVPVITKHNMMMFNSPHNAPMWRRKIHNDVGYFNANFKSAADYEFWMRCLNAGKIFYKINDPHVIYFQNPNGLSTKPETRGLVEAKEISKQFCKIFISDMLTMPFNEFCSKIGITDSLDDGSLNRYMMAKYALRNISRYNKFE